MNEDIVVKIIKKLKIDRSDYSNREFSFCLAKELKNKKHMSIDQICSIKLPFNKYRYTVEQYISIKLNLAYDLEEYIDLYHKKNKTGEEEHKFSHIRSEYIPNLNHHDLGELEIIADLVNPKYYQDVIDVVLDSHYLNLAEDTIRDFKKIIQDKQKQLLQKR